PGLAARPGAGRGGDRRVVPAGGGADRGGGGDPLRLPLRRERGGPRLPAGAEGASPGGGADVRDERDRPRRPLPAPPDDLGRAAALEPPRDQPPHLLPGAVPGGAPLLPPRRGPPVTVPLVSVVVPCHDAEEFVGETLDSLLAQTHPRPEVVVVDDAST